MGEAEASDNKAFLLNIAQMDPSDQTREMQEQLDLIAGRVVERPLIMVNLTTAGRIAGGEATYSAIQNYLDERNYNADLAEIGSIGLLNEEPVVSVLLPGRTRVYFKKITSSLVSNLLDDIFHNTLPEELVIGQVRDERTDAWPDIPFLDEIPFFGLQNRIVLKDCGIINPLSIKAYIAGGGYNAFLKTIRKNTFEEVCDLIEESGLRGRSGSGFSTGKKWKIALNTPADQKYLVCNAEESDPGAFMDRAIMEGNPHQLIEGICIAAYGIGTTRAYIYIRTEYGDAIRKLEEALQSAREYGFLGHDIFDSGFNLDISIRKGPGAFVCGEETALIASLEGRRGMPQTKPPYPAKYGYHGKPTIINNVETLANIPLIITGGAEWFRSIGNPDCPGTKIFSVSGRSKITGLVEVTMGTSLSYIIMDIMGGVKRGRELKGVHLGGPAGCVIPADKMDIQVCYDSLAESGLLMGAGGILVLDDQTCVVNMARYFISFVDMQSCGKCIPCREGTRRLAEILDSVCSKKTDEEQYTSLDRFKDVMQIESLAEVMKDTSLCGLGKSAPNPVLSSLKYFRSEFEEHIFDRNCRSNTCAELRTYYIDVDFCSGCSICAKRCPTEAIIGAKKHPYFILQEKCIACGICMEVCKFGAVFYK